MLKRNILLAVHGSSVPGAKQSYENIERIVKKEFRDIPVFRAYTSAFIRRKLAGLGIKTNSITESLTEMKRNGVKEVLVQSLHVAPGSAYGEIIKAVEPFNNDFEKISVGVPMLTSADDLEKFSKALEPLIPNERTKDDAVILIGHGRRGSKAMVFTAVADVLNKKDNKIFVGAIGDRSSFEQICQAVKQSGAKKAYLIPMMIVAGGHALCDIAGSKDGSWQTMLEKDGVKCVPLMKGLGENDNMAAIFVDHLKEAVKL